MGKTILRVAEGIELNSTVLASLKNILGSDLVLETYSTTPNLETIYNKRIAILNQAFQFITQAIPPKSNKENLNNYLSWGLHICNLSSCKSLNDYQDKLAQFTALLVNALLDNWEDFTTIGETQAKRIAIEMLNKAEQYIIMRDGRPNLATLSVENTFNEPKLILQWDETLPPYTNETLAELKKIKNSNLWITPEWFRQLPPVLQIFLHVSDVHAFTYDALKSNLSTLESVWKYIKTHMEQESLLNDLRIVAEDKLPKPSWFDQLSIGHQVVFRELASKVASEGLASIDAQLSQIKQLLGLASANFEISEINQLWGHVTDDKEMRKVPYWFLRLPAYEQLFLKKVLLEANKVEDVVSYLPSRLRSLPLLANFGKHQLFLLYPDGQVKELGHARLRSSHLSSRDLEDEPAILGQEHSNRNVKQICKYIGKNQSLLVQTLISPLALPGKFLPDPILDKHRRHAIERLRSERKDIKIYTTNHPLNIAKYWLYTSSYDEDCLTILNNAQETLSLSNITQKAKELNVGDKFAVNIISLLALAYCYPNAFNALRQFVENPKTKENNSLSCERFINQLFSEHKIPEEFYDNLWPGHKFNKEVITKSLKYLISSKESHPAAFTLANNLTDLAELCRDYDSCLNAGYGKATIFDYHCRELWLSSLETLITMFTNGLSYGSCVSGKDRKALEILHTNAMLIYREIYGTWPKFADTKEARERFEEMVEKAYESRHGQVHAGRNAEGAEGFKTPPNYLPYSIIKKIKLKAGDQALIIDDRLATNNEVRRIAGLATYIKPGYSHCVIAAMRLSEQNQEKLLEKIKLLIGEKSYWQKQLNYRMFTGTISPKGITQIQQLFEDVTNLKEISDVKTRILADIYYIVLNRPADSDLRTGTTKAVYKSIIELYKSANPDTQIDSVLEKLQETKTKSFEDNIKEINQTFSPI
ncbi:Dot/Icm T4SS effector PI-3-phosphatase SidP [Legionella sp. D16C41]|uniref:Dot/Icm T4SS effector PI-3-phosphatase SidP n=1 Tax=Legionella sp. D16C41 TaxID=3402688 RepID=UPI003AF50162